MERNAILDLIRRTESPLKRQLLTAALITRELEQRGKSAPVVIGGCALSYYAREVYFTADIDLAYADREALGAVLADLGFEREGRYWVQSGLNLAVEAPASNLAGEDAPREIVEMGLGLQCTILGIEDLLIDRLNAWKHWRSETDGELVELLVRRYNDDLDWDYLEEKALLPENDTLAKVRELKKGVGG
jgi:hypothetical protein